MEFKDKIKNISNEIIKFLLFIVATATILYIIPREARFKYQFQEGKPWQYNLLTAPFDFTLQKSESELEYEYKTVLKNYRPYFTKDSMVYIKNIERLDTILAHKDEFSTKEKKSLRKLITHVYEKGIISWNDLTTLTNSGYESLFIVDKHVGQENLIEDLFTTKTAYEYILNTFNSEKSDLIASDLNNCLSENLSFNEAMSNEIKEETLRNISKTSGLIQKGERIIDHGEIVEEDTYKILTSLKDKYEKQIDSVEKQRNFVIGQSIIILCLIFCLFLYLKLFRPTNFTKNRDISFLLILVVAFVLITSLLVKHTKLSIYIIPYAIVPLCVRIFIDSRTALYTHLVTILLCSFMASFPFEFLLLQIVIGMIAVCTLRDMTQRSQLIRSIIIIFATYSILYVGYSLTETSSLSEIELTKFIYFAINCVLLLFIYALIFIFEKLFGFISSVTLMELSNTNSPLLRKLSEEAPGTFQHSLQVSNLAAEAAVIVNANSLLARTGALYHDIGKLYNPIFFYENQHSGTFPHRDLEFERSAQIIIAHIEEGVKIAEKYQLPQAIIEFIQTHHGLSKTKFFYNSYINQFPGRPIDDKIFSYPGPNPNTKETALVMMADGVEAASRSLKEYTEENIDNIVETIINNQLSDGLLSSSPLTFKDIEKIKLVFKKRLKNIYHTRISYPELKK